MKAQGLEKGRENVRIRRRRRVKMVGRDKGEERYGGRDK